MSFSDWIEGFWRYQENFKFPEIIYYIENLELYYWCRSSPLCSVHLDGFLAWENFLSSGTFSERNFYFLLKCSIHLHRWLIDDPSITFCKNNSHRWRIRDPSISYQWCIDRSRRKDCLVTLRGLLVCHFHKSCSKTPSINFSQKCMSFEMALVRFERCRGIFFYSPPHL